MNPNLFEFFALPNQSVKSVVHWDISLFNEGMSVNKRIRIVVVNGDEAAYV
jgi:hypothetical protein